MQGKMSQFMSKIYYAIMRQNVVVNLFSMKVSWTNLKTSISLTKILKQDNDIKFQII